MKYRIIICLFVILPTVCAHIFLRVGLDGLCRSLEEEDQVRECARQCIASITYKQFCYGFTLEVPQVRFGDSIFSLSKEHKAVDKCEQFCKNRGTTFASIHSKEENDFVKEFCTVNAPNTKFACGLGVKTWKTGQENKWDVYHEGLNIDGTILDYKNYAPYEPRNSAGEDIENCVVMFTSPANVPGEWKFGEWNNKACSTKVQCLCRRKIEE